MSTPFYRDFGITDDLAVKPGELIKWWPKAKDASIANRCQLYNQFVIYDKLLAIEAKLGSHGATGHHLDVMSADAVVQTTVSTASTAPPSQGDGGLENGYSVVNESVQESLDSAGHDLPITAAEAMILPKTIVSTAFIAPSQVNGSLANGYPVFHDNVHEYLDSAAPVPEAPMSELPPLIQRFILSNSGTSEELLSNGQVKAPVLPNGANEELPSNCEELPSNGEIKAHVLTSTQVSNTEIDIKSPTFSESTIAPSDAVMQDLAGLVFEPGSVIRSVSPSSTLGPDEEQVVSLRTTGDSLWDRVQALGSCNIDDSYDNCSVGTIKISSHNTTPPSSKRGDIPQFLAVQTTRPKNSSSGTTEFPTSLSTSIRSSISDAPLRTITQSGTYQSNVTATVHHKSLPPTSTTSSAKELTKLTDDKDSSMTKYHEYKQQYQESQQQQKQQQQQHTRSASISKSLADISNYNRGKGREREILVPATQAKPSQPQISQPSDKLPETWDAWYAQHPDFEPPPKRSKLQLPKPEYEFW